MPCTFIREVVRHGPDTKVRSISEQGNSGWADRGKSLARPAIRHREKLRPARRSRPDGPAPVTKLSGPLFSMAGGTFVHKTLLPLWIVTVMGAGATAAMLPDPVVDMDRATPQHAKHKDNAGFADRKST